MSHSPIYRPGASVCRCPMERAGGGRDRGFHPSEKVRIFEKGEK